MYPFESRYFGHSHEVCEGSHGGRSACEAIFDLIAGAADALSYSSDPTAREAARTRQNEHRATRKTSLCWNGRQSLITGLKPSGRETERAFREHRLPQ